MRFRASHLSTLASTSDPGDDETPARSHDTGESFGVPSGATAADPMCELEQQCPSSSREDVPGSNIHASQTGLSDGITLTEAETLELALQAHPAVWIPSPRLPADPLEQAAAVTEEERKIFEYYLLKSGAWLDIVSADHCFAQLVPGQAMHKPVLYSACVAYAAQHMLLSGDLGFEKASGLHSEAINRLVPLLHPDCEWIPRDILLATTVLLRMSEQFSEPDQDAQCHMNGAFALVVRHAAKWSPTRTDIEGVCFWVFVRQSLRIAFLFSHPCNFDLNVIDDTNLLTSARDDVWTNRMTFLLAKVASTCCEQEHDTALRSQTLRNLEAQVTAWSKSVPKTFQPWFYRQAPNRSFPTIRYLNRWHGQILLIHYPRDGTC